MAQLTWVRGNSVLLAVTLTQKKTDGTEEPIDLSVYDAWASGARIHQGDAADQRRSHALRAAARQPTADRRHAVAHAREQMVL